MSRNRKIITFVGVLGFAFIAFGAYVAIDVTHPPSATGDRVRVTIARGEGLSAVLKDLESQGLVRHAWTLEFFARTLGDDRKVRRGTYEFAVGTPAVQILRAMVQGDVLAVRVTIPEGFTTWQIAGAFRAAGIDSTAMLAATRDSTLLHVWRVPTGTLEGYLFPDTYKVPFGSEAGDVVAQMLERFNSEWTPEFSRRASEIGMTRHQVLALASVVEAEARVPEERPVVSAVYHNRLRTGMRLEADPTVAYAMGGFRGRLLYKDLEIDSPYNTYKHAGLPPGPICSPGASSIRAALYPDETVTALYFVARGDGTHVFSTTLADHHAAVRAARRNRDRQSTSSRP